MTDAYKPVKSKHTQADDDNNGPLKRHKSNTVTVRVSDPYGGVTDVKVRSTDDTSVLQLYDVADAAGVRFVHDGAIVRGDQKLSDLILESGDHIDAVEEQEGGGLKGVKKELKRLYNGQWLTGLASDCTSLFDELMPNLFKLMFTETESEQESTDKLCDRLLRPYQDFFATSRNARLAIITGDKSEYVPAGEEVEYLKTAEGDAVRKVSKAATQKARSAAWLKGHNKAGQTHKPYPMHCIINEIGVHDPNNGTSEYIDMGRLLFTRPLRILFFRWLWKRMQAVPWPDHANIIFDADSTIGTVMLHRGKVTPLPLLTNRIGEGELSLVWWIKKIYESFPKERLLVHTIDSDAIPTLVYHLWDTPCSVVYAHWSQEYIEIQDFIALLKSPPSAPRSQKKKVTVKTKKFTEIEKEEEAAKLKRAQSVAWTKEWFVGACILSGTDYFDKQTATHFIGHSTMWDAFSEVYDKLDHKKVVKPAELFDTLTRACYGHTLGWSKDEKHPLPPWSWIGSHQTSRMKAPIDKDVYKAALDAFLANYEYWVSLGYSAGVVAVSQSSAPQQSSVFADGDGVWLDNADLSHIP